jgi:uncharacterized protein (DUF2147 family)
MWHRSKCSEATKPAATRRIGMRATLAFLLLSSTPVLASAADTPVGVWQTIDDRTHEPRALVEITRDENGTLSGKVVKGLGPAGSHERRCTACQDERKDQKIVGMTIIRKMHQDGNVWDGGDILDPESGKVYRCQMRLEDDGRKLVVRGYIGVSLIGRSQTWIRQGDAAGERREN